MGVYVKQVLLNKKHEPSKGISAAFKSYYYPTEIDTAGTETVTTPAGTFDCIRLKGKVFEDNSAYKVNYQYTWWLARGVGFVKYEMLNVDGKDPKVPTTILLNKLERP